MLLISLLLFAGLVLSGFLVLRFNPVFGRQAPPEKRAVFEQSRNYAAGRFMNQVETLMDTSAGSMFSMLKEYFKGNPNRRPREAIPIKSLPAVGRKESASAGQPQITWLGHSALFLELDGKKILLDPMLGTAPSPFPWFGNQRYSKKLPFAIEQLPWIDAVILSHDHYDHLDYPSIQRLKDQVGHFFVPLGVGSHLERWGIKKELITEHDWWEESDLGGIRLTAAPARHFSGRSVNDRNRTLWCSWVIRGREAHIFFSGDSGYGPHFQEIGEKYGPFDLTLMECGQYDERWSTIHMMPEETVQAHVDVQGRLLLPIHWGAFTLGFHDWTDPVERVTKAAKPRGIAVATPQIGEPVPIGTASYPASAWWRG
ncbi:MBL fold metallo-hydrolase [Paenibacillus sp. y28]|uniref:MBL fold metallo-hydrolase n=1 Tax=Paenibacillus sp. y28 TaxID=3129110 RepID=UPI00301AED51